MNAIQIQRGASAGTAPKAGQCAKSARKAFGRVMNQRMEVAGDRFTVAQLAAVSLCWPSLMLGAGWLMGGRLLAALAAGAVAVACIVYLSNHETEEGGEL